jgi:hypothetical protein
MTNLCEAQVGEATGGTGLAVACPRQARQVPHGGEVNWHIRRIQNLLLVA